MARTIRTGKFYTPFQKGEKHILFGKPPHNKGKKFPHSKGWEKRRIIAVREAAKKRVYPKGYHRPKSAIEPMKNGLKKWREENPDKVREFAIRNLSKSGTLDLSGKNSPMWRGGITKEWQKWKSSHGKQLSDWRDLVKKNCGGMCKKCGSTENLEAHHIIPLAETYLTAFLPMNGVMLCAKCHRGTDSFGGKSKGVEKLGNGIGNPMVFIKTIPHEFQIYETCGNYDWVGNLLVVFVSDMGNEDSEFAVAVHEQIEAFLCRKNGITIDEINDWDIWYEEARELKKAACGCKISKYGEPGDDVHAPYYKEHQFATAIEKLLVKAMHMRWREHDARVNKLFK